MSYAISTSQAHEAQRRTVTGAEWTTRRARVLSARRVGLRAAADAVDDVRDRFCCPGMSKDDKTIDITAMGEAATTPAHASSIYTNGRRTAFCNWARASS
jgi:hypothetical protein